jgi:antitoxin VapB
MAINIKNAELDRLARELARRRGDSVTNALLHAVKEELRREAKRVRDPDVIAKANAIVEHYCSLPLLDTRSDDEILGYDEHGIPR